MTTTFNASEVWDVPDFLNVTVDFNMTDFIETIMANMTTVLPLIGVDLTSSTVTATSTTTMPPTTVTTTPATTTSSIVPTTSTGPITTTSMPSTTTMPLTTSMSSTTTISSTTTMPSTTMTTTMSSTTTMPTMISTSTITPTSTSTTFPTNFTLFKPPSTVTTTPIPINLTEVDVPCAPVAPEEVVQNVVEVYRLRPRDCCMSVSNTIITLVVFALIVATIIAIWMICVAYLRKREKNYCMESVQKVNDDMYRNGKPSRQSGQFMPGPVVMTPEFKMEQFLKNMQNKPAPITTDERCIGGVLNYLAQNPIEDEVIYRPGRQDVVLEPRDLPSKMAPKSVPMLPTESELTSITEVNPHRSKNHNHRNGLEPAADEPVLFGGRNLNHTKSAPRKIKKKNMNPLKKTFKKKHSKKSKSRKPTPPGILPPPKSPATTPPQPLSPNPYRSQDRVVYQDGSHYRA